MKIFRKFIVPASCLALFLLMILSSCSSEPEVSVNLSESEARLGSVEMNVTGKEEAKDEFKKGLLLLHSFEYSDARKAFQKAREIDPDMAMAYWGEAMTHNHPLWRGQKTEKAKAVLEELGESEEERLKKAGSELERDFLQSLEILYYGEGDKNERDVAYSEFLEKLHEKYPDDHEVAAFYALSLLGAVPVGRDDEMYEKGARVALSILEENPDHPGALHYSIHSYDDPYHAHLAREVADRYSQVAPDAAHALHMPSHIYVALGLWHDVVRSNIASWNASVNRMQDKGLSQNSVSYHALHWLLYGYLQQGNRLMADSIMSNMQRYMAISPSKTARSYMIEMMGNYLAETGEWTHPFADTEVDIDSLNIVNQSEYFFIKGMRDYKSGLGDFLFMTMDRMRRERERAELFVTEEGLPLCSSASSFIFPNRLDIQQSKVMELLLKASHADLQGDSEKTEKIFREAIDLESTLSYSYGPPVIPYPPAQMYADWLIERKRYGEALEYYEKALERGPGRTLVLRKALQAAEGAGDNEKANKLSEELSRIEQETGKDHGDPQLYWASN